MSKKRTKKEINRAENKRIALAKKRFKTATPSQQSTQVDNTAQLYRKVFGYNLALVKKDLIKTCLMTALVSVGLLLIYFYT
jgi:hypothetical protein